MKWSSQTQTEEIHDPRYGLLLARATLHRNRKVSIRNISAVFYPCKLHRCTMGRNYSIDRPGAVC